MLVAARFKFFLRTTKKPCSLTDQGLVVFPGRLVSPRRLPGHVRKVSASSLPRYPRGGCHSPRTAAAQPVAAPVGALCNVLLVWKSCIPPARGSVIRQGRGIIDSNRQVSTGFREITSAFHDSLLSVPQQFVDRRLGPGAFVHALDDHGAVDVRSRPSRVEGGAGQ